MRYVYPAIFTPDTELENYYVVEFPDIEVAVTQGKNFSGAYHMAEDVLGLALMTMENEDAKIPKATDLKSIEVDDDKIVGLVETDTCAYRKIFDKERNLHEAWYSPITERKFFVIKSNDDEELCERLLELLSKVSGVNVSD
ncbi:MAG: type II toxin-antitoxin system HicB family antitoxin [Selenomonadaceae bacterium]|nr:type II toxin-antitoxin system HicB family antitoxin [Selenomonadaceae bacterium]